MTIPIVMTATGRQLTDVSTLRSNLLALVASEQPGYTATLPGILIEDMSSTCVGALATMDAGVTELIDSVTPYGANETILTAIAAQCGVTIGAASNTSAYVNCTGTPGFPIPVGFTFTDGTYQYTIQDGGIIGAAPSGQSVGTSGLLYVLATVAGTWAVAANSITKLVTSLPTGVTLTVTNPSVGTPGSAGPTEEQIRAQTLQAQLAVSSGMTTTLKTALKNVPGVQPNLISVQATGTSWRVIIGGGDPYQVANAIFLALFNFNALVGSAISTARNVTVQIFDAPDTYSILFVVPVQQTVTVTTTWNTTGSSLYVNPAAVTALVQAPLAAYLNNLTPGTPINVFELQNVFQAAVSTIIPLQSLTRLVTQVYIGGVLQTPTAGTGLIQGDVEGYYLTTAAQMTVNQG